jgi:NMD protein affecting ribosome stability and mRNA decay
MSAATFDHHGRLCRACGRERALVVEQGRELCANCYLDLQAAPPMPVQTALLFVEDRRGLVIHNRGIERVNAYLRESGSELRLARQ